MLSPNDMGIKKQLKASLDDLKGMEASHRLVYTGLQKMQQRNQSQTESDSAGEGEDNSEEEDSAESDYEEFWHIKQSFEESVKEQPKLSKEEETRRLKEKMLMKFHNNLQKFHLRNEKRQLEKELEGDKAVEEEELISSLFGQTEELIEMDEDFESLKNIFCKNGIDCDLLCSQEAESEAKIQKMIEESYQKERSSKAYDRYKQYRELRLDKEVSSSISPLSFWVLGIELRASSCVWWEGACFWFFLPFSFFELAVLGDYFEISKFC